MADEKIIEIIKDINERSADILVHKRFTKAELQETISKEFGFACTVGVIDDEGCSCDYQFVVGIGEDFGYIDIYYLKVPFDEKDIYVTEVHASED